MLAFPPLPAAASVMARLLNNLLSREDWAQERLALHAGKSVRFAAAPWRINLGILHDGRVQASDSAIVPDVTLTFPSEKLGQVPAILRSADSDQIIALLHIQGDAGLAKVVSELAQGLRWDIEDDLSRFVGDAAAVRLVGAARGVSQSAQRAARRLAENVGEYLVYEDQQLLGRVVFDEWRDTVALLQQRLTALEARVQRLDRAHSNGRS